LTRPLNFLVYENTAWIPTRAQFGGADADATRQAGLDSLARLELRPLAAPVGVGAPDNADLQFAAQPGAVTVATGVDQRWSLDVAGQSIAPRPAFGVTTGYDVTAAGPAALRYHTDASRAFALVGQLLLWLLLALGVSRFDTASVVRWRRRRVDAAPDEPLLSIDAPIVAPIDMTEDSSVLLSMGDEPVSWETAGETLPAEQPDTEQPDTEPHEAGVE
jgi:hypothetical protein